MRQFAMKFISLFFLSFFLLIGINSIEAQKDCHADLCSKQRIFKTKLKSASSTSTQIDVIYQRCYWEIKPEEIFIKGSITTYFKKLNPEAKIAFDLRTEMQVDSIKHQNSLISFSHEDDVVKIANPELFNELDSVSVYYQGFPDASGFGSFLNTELETGGYCLWTLSQPYGCRDWWPTKQSLTDKLDSIDILVKTTVPNVVGSNGILTNQWELDGYTYYQWKHRYPIAPYLVSLAVAPYQITFSSFEMSDGTSLPVYQYSFENETDDGAFGLAKAIQYLGFFTNLFTPYPFSNEKYGHASCGFSGGMEHQTMSSMGGYGANLISHELAHQWFGDYITCNSWRDIWLNEGFATYLAALTDSMEFGNDFFRQWLRDRNSDVTSINGGSVWVDDTSTVNRIFDYRLTYIKGALVLHMLRKSMGDKLFYQAMQNYLNDPALKFGFAQTSDLIRHVNNVTQNDYTTFFDQWVYKEGYPLVNLKWNQNSDERVTLNFNQTTSHSSVNLFELKLPVYFYGESGEFQKEIVDFSSFQLQTSIKIPFKVSEVKLNEEHDFIGIYTDTKSNFESAAEVEIFPNPSIDYFKIRLNGNTESPVNIELYQTDGQLILSKNVENWLNNEINISWPEHVSKNGLFILKIGQKNSNIFQKIVKLKN